VVHLLDLRVRILFLMLPGRLVQIELRVRDELLLLIDVAGVFLVHLEVVLLRVVDQVLANVLVGILLGLLLLADGVGLVHQELLQHLHVVGAPLGEAVHLPLSLVPLRAAPTVVLFLISPHQEPN